MTKLVNILKQILLEEKKKSDRCKRIADRRYDKPSAYKSGAIVRCRQGKIWKDLKEEVVGNKIICDNCGWSWKKEDGGKDMYICHNKLSDGSICGHDNTPKLNESKQLGNLYHFTYDSSILNILKNGLRFAPDNTELDKHKNKFYISTTRDYTGRKFYNSWEHTARVTLDGNKISEHYSVEPINVENIWSKSMGFNQNLSSKDIFLEERIFSSKGGYLDPKYIIKIDTIITEDEIRRGINWGKEDSNRSTYFDDSIFNYINSGKLNFVKDFNSITPEKMNEIEEKRPKVSRIYFDLDGVLAGFDNQFKKYNEEGLDFKEYIGKYGSSKAWDIINKGQVKYWSEMPWNPGGQELYNYVMKMASQKGIEVWVLSSPGLDPNGDAKKGKNEWLDKHTSIPQNRRVFKQAKNKHTEAKEGYILIDDMGKNTTEFTQAGGIGIKNNPKNSKESIEKLHKYEL